MYLIRNKKNKAMMLASVLILSVNGQIMAQNPLVIEGAVPNVQIKQEILSKMYTSYGQENVIDKIQIRMVTAPTGWSNIVSNAITDDLKKVTQGNFTVRGTQVNLVGKVASSADIQPISKSLQASVPAYKVNANLSVNMAEQQIIDAALKNRIIEFESGSAVLTSSGMQILNEMAVALNKVATKNVKIIGHTDSSGELNKNVSLSQARAIAVKNYLVNKRIIASSITTEGLGSSRPVADNTTPEGRKKNRRIEFEVM